MQCLEKKIFQNTKTCKKGALLQVGTKRLPLTCFTQQDIAE